MSTRMPTFPTSSIPRSKKNKETARRGPTAARNVRGHSSVGRALEWHSRGRRFDSAWLHQTLLASFIALSGSENMGLRRHLAALPWIIVRLRVHDHGSPKRSEEAYPQPFESAFPRFSSQPHETG